MERRRDPYFLSNKKKNKTEDKQPILEKSERKFDKQKRKQAFDKNRNKNAENTTEKDEKKPFDKKTYRLKKYSKKYKLDQWEEQRKKKLLRNYYKETKDDPTVGSYKPKSFDDDDEPEAGRFVRHPDLIEKSETDGVKNTKKKDPYQKAKEEYNRIKQSKVDKKLENEKAKEERKVKLAEYKKKKQERFKKLSKKTKKGQPVMSGRMELLLEKLQKK